MTVERIRCPELLLQPAALAGVEQAGLNELILRALSELTPAQRKACQAGGVLLTGGNSIFPGLDVRYEAVADSGMGTHLCATDCGHQQSRATQSRAHCRRPRAPLPSTIPVWRLSCVAVWFADPQAPQWYRERLEGIVSYEVRVKSLTRHAFLWPERLHQPCVAGKVRCNILSLSLQERTVETQLRELHVAYI